MTDRQVTELASRREFLQWTALVGGGLLIGCSTDDGGGPAPGAVDGGVDGGIDGMSADASTADAHTTDAGTTDALTTDALTTDAHTTDAQTTDGGDSVPLCPDPWAGGTFLGLVSFVQEGGKPIATKFGEGWDGRYYCDLEKLDLQTMTMPIGQFYIRTVYPDTLTAADQAKWTVTVGEGGAADKTFTTTQLQAMAKDMGVHLMECSGNGKGGKFGLISAASWAGVPVADLLGKAPAGKPRVLIEGYDKHSKPSDGAHSKPGASWIFTAEQLKSAFLATGMNGQPLPEDHGKPARLLVPGWYGCCNIKWVTAIRWVEDDVAATSQMLEFASRTHQDGVPSKAKDYKPATMDQAAMPIRVERWQLADGSEAMRIIGVMWGGYALTDALQITIGQAAPVAVKVCPPQTTNATWTRWEHLWQPSGKGTYSITMQIGDKSVPTRRLDLGWYKRVVAV